MTDSTYKITMEMRSPWIVGYHPERDELFMYYVDQEEIAWIFTRFGLDGAGFPEFFNLSSAIILGEL